MKKFLKSISLIDQIKIVDKDMKAITRISENINEEISLNDLQCHVDTR